VESTKPSTQLAELVLETTTALPDMNEDRIVASTGPSSNASLMETMTGTAISMPNSQRVGPSHHSGPISRLAEHAAEPTGSLASTKAG